MTTTETYQKVRTKKVLNYASDRFCKLSKNPKHQFASRFALKIYSSNSIYTFIPKNACSTLRYSVAVENGVISDLSEIRWIHENNETFNTNLESLVTADYSFVILRCPYRRLVSCYLDRIARLKSAAWHFLNLTNQKYSANELSFYNFVTSLRDLDMVRANMHWRPQIDFLVYEKYDDYFAFKDFDHVVSELKEKINLDVVDTREALGHHFGLKKKYDIEDGFYLHPLELQPMLAKDFIPTNKCMYNEELIEIVQDLYKTDIELYKKKFGEEHLLY